MQSQDSANVEKSTGLSGSGPSGGCGFPGMENRYLTVASHPEEKEGASLSPICRRYAALAPFSRKCIAAKLTTEASSMFHCSYFKTSPTRFRAGAADLRNV